jgi:hypothetical protein
LDWGNNPHLLSELKMLCLANRRILSYESVGDFTGMRYEEGYEDAYKIVGFVVHFLSVAFSGINKI